MANVPEPGDGDDDGGGTGAGTGAAVVAVPSAESPPHDISTAEPATPKDRLNKKAVRGFTGPDRER